MKDIKTINDLIERNEIQEEFAFTITIKSTVFRCMKLGEDIYIEKCEGKKEGYEIGGVMDLDELLCGWQVERFNKPVSKSVADRWRFYDEELISEITPIA